MAARPSKGPAKRMTIYLRPPEVIETLKVIAILEGKSLIDLVNEAIDDLLKKRE